MTSLNPNTEAFFFDVFGTCVDWRKTVTNALDKECSKALQNSSKAISAGIRSKAESLGPSGWGDIAQEWRETYYVFTRSLAKDASLRFKTVDDHHLEALIKILRSRGLTRAEDDDGAAGDLFSRSEIEHLSTVWHRLDSWADTNEALEILAQRFQTATLSNGNVSLLEDMQQYSGMKFTHTLSSELFGTYKPNPAIYKGAAERLGFRTSQCVMVAAHLGDLEAAKGCGLQTVYVERPREETMDVDEARTKGFVDVWIKEDEEGFLGMVRKLGLEKNA